MTLETEIQDDFTSIVLVADLASTGVSFQSPIETTDEIGSRTIEWSVLYGAEPCRFRPLSEREIEQYSRETVRATHACWCEYHADITETCRATIGGRVFDIVSILNWHEQDIILKIILAEVV